MDRVQQLEGEKMYIRYTSEINKVHTRARTHTHTHAEALLISFVHSSCHNLSLIPFIDFTIGDSMAGTTSVTTLGGFHFRPCKYRDEAYADPSGQAYLTDDLGIISFAPSVGTTISYLGSRV